MIIGEALAAMKDAATDEQYRKILFDLWELGYGIGYREGWDDGYNNVLESSYE